MAETKRFLDYQGLQNYDTVIKEDIDAKDAKILAEAKEYADDVSLTWGKLGENK